MSIYTEEALDKLNKKELITILLSLQSKVESANNEILVQMRQLNKKFSQLGSENSVVMQANSLLSKIIGWCGKTVLGKRPVFQKRVSWSGGYSWQCSE